MQAGVGRRERRGGGGRITEKKERKGEGSGGK